MVQTVKLNSGPVAEPAGQLSSALLIGLFCKGYESETYTLATDRGFITRKSPVVVRWSNGWCFNRVTEKLLSVAG